MDLKFLFLLSAISLFAEVSEAKSIRNDSDNDVLKEIKQTVSDLSAKVQILNESLQKERDNHVMFYAIMKGKSITYNVDAIIVFETVIVNEGGHYNRYDGVFVAPKTGIYLFAWTVSGNGASYIVTELVVEENVISSTGEYNGGGGHPSGSMTALCKMESGDHAWIRTTGVSTGHVIYSYDNYPQSSFLGLLIFNQ